MTTRQFQLDFFGQFFHIKPDEVWKEKKKYYPPKTITILIQNVVNIVCAIVVSNFFFAIVLFQKTANELYLGGSYGSLGFAQKMYLNTFLVLETTALVIHLVF